MSNPTKMAVEALRDAPGASALLARCETAPLTRPLLPGLELAAARCDLRDGTLWITVDTGAESAKLRQAAPRLLAALTAHGYQVYELKTRIQHRPRLSSVRTEDSHTSRRLVLPRTDSA